MARIDSPPVEYLRQCSDTSLRYFEMCKLEHAANLRRELAVLLDEMMEETALALLARWMLDKRGSRSRGGRPATGEKARGARGARKLLANWLSFQGPVEADAPAAACAGQEASSTEPAPGGANLSKAGEEDSFSAVAQRPNSAAPGATRSEKRPERKGGRGARAAWSRVSGPRLSEEMNGGE